MLATNKDVDKLRADMESTADRLEFATDKQVGELRNEIESLRQVARQQSEYIQAQQEALSGALDRLQALEVSRRPPTHFSGIRAPEVKQ